MELNEALAKIGPIPDAPEEDAPDRDAIERIRHERLAAWDVVFGEVRSLALRLPMDAEVREETCAGMALKLLRLSHHRRTSLFASAAGARAWLFVTARNLARDGVRATQRRVKRSVLLEGDDIPGPESSDAFDAVDVADVSEEIQQARRTVEQGIAAIAASLRGDAGTQFVECLQDLERLHDDELTIDELVQERFGDTNRTLRGTLRTRQFRARKRLIEWAHALERTGEHSSREMLAIWVVLDDWQIEPSRP